MHTLPQNVLSKEVSHVVSVHQVTIHPL